MQKPFLPFPRPMALALTLAAAWLSPLLLGNLCLHAGEAADQVKTAAKALGDKSNYSWKTTVDSAGNARFRPGPTEGKTEKEGFTHLSMTRGDNTYEVVTKGGRTAVKLPDGWKTVAEATETGGEGRQNPGRMISRILQNFKAPAAEAESLLAQVKDLKKDGDTLSGDLTEDGIKALATLGGRRGADAPVPTDGKGTVKFWVKDGVLTQYQYHVQAKISFNGNDMDIDRTTTVEIKNVGSTKLDIPEDAKKKLS